MEEDIRQRDGLAMTEAAAAERTELPDTDKIEAAGLYLFTDWDDLPGSVRCGARDLLGYVMAWGRRLAAAEQAVERLTREREDALSKLRGAHQLSTQALEQAVREEARAEAAEARLARAREALERIAGSRAHDMNTLHPEGCAHVAAEALRALADSETAGRAALAAEGE